ncbi:hypothetical protein [Streptomyces sp. KLOTTS4A1]|uniref:hypothetical protein n=1 Tax=Streptomyces sp. KLOTTS4A1 TaxID=3390996 RepID=UPI0039F5E8BD
MSAHRGDDGVPGPERGEHGPSWAGHDGNGPSRPGGEGQRDQRDQQGLRDRRGQHQEHGGYGTVNGASGPEYGPDRRGQDEAGPWPGTGLGPDADFRPDLGPDADLGLDADELALRRLMRGAVQDMNPSEDALAKLHRAVPARRARKRRAVVGMAAAALLIGTAVPAVFQIATSPAANDNLSSAGDSSLWPGEKGTDLTGDSEGAQGGQGSGAGSGTDEEQGAGRQEPGEGATESSGVSASPTEEVPSGAPNCDASMLADSTVETGEAQPDGKVYGAFKVANTSDADCTVAGPGSVTFAAQGAAQASKISVVEHVAGDPAEGLPPPVTEPTPVVLKPGQSYAVRFAWVPSAACPTAKPSPDPSPTPNNGGEGGSTGDSGSVQTGSDTKTQLGSEDEEPSGGSVSITHTADPGTPTVVTTIPNACAGTIYRTKVLLDVPPSQ